ncbi:MAG: hypothetical protein HGA53_09565 [Anaerolineaceae bacterium]|nr:hypothetical protein [Anaerolineaceae bacterium]
MTTSQNRETLEPPDELDGAEVILWAFTPQKPFFIMVYSDGTPYKPIHGFAICRYKGESQYYKFSCDIEWNVENDMDCDSIEEAVKIANDMTIEPITWNKKTSSIINSQM